MRDQLRPRLRRPRQTVRLRLTLLYGGLFLVSGAGLLAITYLLVARQSGDDFLFVRGAVKGITAPNIHTVGPMLFTDGSGIKINGLTYRLAAPGNSVNPSTLRQLQAQARQLQAQADQLQTQARQLRAQATRQHAAELHQLLVVSGIALAIMAVAAIGLGWLVAGRVLHPLRTITAAVREISASNLHARLALAGPDDELKELGETFDGLLGRLEAAFEAQRRFVANASHELRTPLARQRTLVEVALGDPEATLDSMRASYARVLAAAEQQERLIEALLTLARSERGLERREPVDLAAVTDEVLLTRRLEMERRGLHVEVALDHAPTAGDHRLVERLVANLVDNAVGHNVAAGRVTISTGTTAGQAILSVANSGPVIPPAAVDRLFQPFQRLGAERTGRQDGLGLGLSIVQAIAAAHGATLSAQARPDGGLAVEVRFPAGEAGTTGRAIASNRAISAWRSWSPRSVGR